MEDDIDISELKIMYFAGCEKVTWALIAKVIPSILKRLEALEAEHEK